MKNSKNNNNSSSSNIKKPITRANVDSKTVINKASDKKNKQNNNPLVRSAENTLPNYLTPSITSQKSESETNIKNSLEKQTPTKATYSVYDAGVFDDKQKFLESKASKTSKYINTKQESLNSGSQTNINKILNTEINKNNMCLTENNEGKNSNRNIEYITKSIGSRDIKRNSINSNKKYHYQYSLNQKGVKNAIKKEQEHNSRTSTSANKLKTQFSNEIINKFKVNELKKHSNESKSNIKSPSYSKKERSTDKIIEKSVPAKLNYRQNSEIKEIEILNKQVKILSIGNICGKI